MEKRQWFWIFGQVGAFRIEEMPVLQAAQEQYANDLVIIKSYRTDTEAVLTGLNLPMRGVSYLLIQDGGGDLYRCKR